VEARNLHSDPRGVRGVLRKKKKKKKKKKKIRLGVSHSGPDRTSVQGRYSGRRRKCFAPSSTLSCPSGKGDSTSSMIKDPQEAEGGQGKEPRRI